MLTERQEGHGWASVAAMPQKRLLQGLRRRQRAAVVCPTQFWHCPATVVLSLSRYGPHLAHVDDQGAASSVQPTTKY